MRKSRPENREHRKSIMLERRQRRLIKRLRQRDQDGKELTRLLHNRRLI